MGRILTFFWGEGRRAIQPGGRRRNSVVSQKVCNFQQILGIFAKQKIKRWELHKRKSTNF